MATKYLDLTGLQRLWNKIKSWAKRNLVTTITYDGEAKAIKMVKYTNNGGTDVETVSTIVSAATLAADAGLSGTYVEQSKVGAQNGVCPLDAGAKVDPQYLPSYVDDVVEAYARPGQTLLSSTWLATTSARGAVITPEAGKIYVLMEDVTEDEEVVYTANTQFRWGGSAYTKLNDGGVSPITDDEIDSIAV